MITHSMISKYTSTRIRNLRREAALHHMQALTPREHEAIKRALTKVIAEVLAEARKAHDDLNTP